MCERIAAAPLDPKVADAIHDIYLAKGALATTAIEGNALSEEEARARIERELELPPSQEYLGEAEYGKYDGAKLAQPRRESGCRAAARGPA